MKKLSIEIDYEYLTAKQNSDEFLNINKYAEAKESYEKLLEIKPEDEYAKRQIELIEKILAKIDELPNEKFNSKFSEHTGH